MIKLALSLTVMMISAFTAAPSIAQDNHWRDIGVHMRTIDDLDRPQDGWCLDAVGSGPHIRFDMPLIGHNCKPGLFADEAVQFTKNGQIRFPAYENACVTVMGLNQHALQGASLMLKACGQEIPFLNAPKFQHFEHLKNGAVKLKGPIFVFRWEMNPKKPLTQRMHGEHFTWSVVMRLSIHVQHGNL